jgi:hypothetical protein
VFAVLGARVGVVPPYALEPVIITSFVLGVAALALAAYSLADIWVSGAEGLAVAMAGVVYALPVLAILGLVAGTAIVYPPLWDVSTDPDNPPSFSAAGTTRGTFDTEQAAVQRAAYPALVSHSYPQPLGQIYEAVQHVVEEKGWAVTRDVHPTFMPTTLDEVGPTREVPEDESVTKALELKSVVTQSRSGMATEARPDLVPEIETPFPSNSPASNEATIEARAATPIFGFMDDVALRLRATEEGTEVDMRSASRVGQHDLGQNARRITQFFAALDARLQPEAAGGTSASQ